MKSALRIILGVFFTLVIQGVTYAQSEFVVQEFDEVKEEWVPFGSLDGVQLSYQLLDCDFNSGFDQRWVVLKFENTTSKKLIVSYSKDLYYNGECKTCNMDEYSYTVTLEPSSNVFGWCTRKEGPELNAFVKSIDPAVVLSDELTKMEITDLNILENE